MKCYIVDAFTKVPFGGNTAGVVLLEKGADFPDDAWMAQLAAELRYSETAFIRPEGPAEFTVRYFTPAGEIDLCGHATIASFSTLFQEGIVEAGTPCINHTRAGDLEILPGPVTMMQMAPARRVGTFENPEMLASLLHTMGGLQAEDLSALPVENISTGLPDIILPVRDVATLQALRPDMDALTRLTVTRPTSAISLPASESPKNRPPARPTPPSLTISSCTESSKTGPNVLFCKAKLWDAHPPSSRP